MIPEPKCFTRLCRHFLGVTCVGNDETTEVPYCMAFPIGIPYEIAYGSNDHTKPVSGDNGIMFEPANSWEEMAWALTTTLATTIP